MTLPSRYAPADGLGVANSIYNAKGDLIVATADNTAARLAVGTDGQSLTADSSQASGQKWRDVAYRRKTGGAEYSLPESSGWFASLTSTQSRLQFAPLLLNQTATLDRMAVSVVTLAASSSGRLGLYSSTDGRPDTLIFEAGATVDCTATGDKEVTVSQALTPGLYWVAAVFQGGAPAVRGLVAAWSHVIASTILSDLTAGGSTPPAWIQAGVTGALPATATPVMALVNYPRVALRFT